MRTILVIALVLTAVAASDLTGLRRMNVNGITMEIRPDPLPGVRLTQGRIAPLPVAIREQPAVPAPLAPCGSMPAVSRPAVATARSEVCLTPGTDAPQAADALPNLFFYTPAGWDYPIVPSNVRNTHTVGPDLNDGDSTFFDWAVGNNGTATARPRFYTYLYRAGSPFAGFYTESLPVGYYTYYNDFAQMIPAGTWLIAGFTDSTNVVAESLENDNRWSRSFTWRATGGARPNLVPYTPAGWDYPIVPSDVRGTNTVGPDLNDYDTTFIDNAFINSGNATARPGFYTYLYVDGRPVNGYYIDSLPPNWYGYYEDDEFFVPAGNHTLGLFVDSTNAVAESDETDNRWSRSFSWRHDPATLPNLVPYTPDTTWDFPLVPSSVRNTHRVGPNLNDRDTTFVDWCVANLGNAWARPRFYVYAYFDGAPFAGWYLDSLPPRTYAHVDDDENLFPSGMHVLGLFTDSTNAVTESDETDNRYARGFNWRHVAGNLPNLTFYTPDSWDYPIVPSNVRNTHTVGPDLNDFDTTFIDFALQNNGGATARPRFYIYLYADAMPFAGFYLDSLRAGYYAAAEDIAEMFDAGDHLLAMFIDSTDAVAESLETDNRWSRSFHWTHRTAVASYEELPAFGLRLGANPMMGTGCILWSVPQSGPTRLSVFDATGRQVLLLEGGQYNAGRHVTAIGATALVPGTYFIVLESGSGRRVATLVKL